MVRPGRPANEGCPDDRFSILMGLREPWGGIDRAIDSLTGDVMAQACQKNRHFCSQFNPRRGDDDPIA